MATTTQAKREAILHQLQSLVCELGDAMSCSAYVDARAELLDALATVQGPWLQKDRLLLGEVMHQGELAMLQMAAAKADVIKRLGALQRARSLNAYSTTSAPGPRRVM